MKRWTISVAAAGALLLIGWGLYRIHCLSADREQATQGRPNPVETSDPMDTPSGWRYRQNQPHHWRYIMLQQ